MGKKVYAVKVGKNPGIYDAWDLCQKQISGFPGAVYKGFANTAEAKAWMLEPHKPFSPKTPPEMEGRKLVKLGGLARNHLPGSWAVDAACQGNPGLMEYRGVDIDAKTELFHLGPLKNGTNNIGEFLAIIHALAIQKEKGIIIPIYTDSVTALSWLKAKNVRTKLERTADTQKIWELIDRALNWVERNQIIVPILKWDTDNWGENPADFGRK